MESLVNALLSNALTATGLALAPLALSRFGRSPALVHSLWLVVLLKLVTPPLVQVPLIIASPRTQEHASEIVDNTSRDGRSMKLDRCEPPETAIRDHGELNARDASDDGQEVTSPARVERAVRTCVRSDLASAVADIGIERPREPTPPLEGGLFSLISRNLARWEVLALALNLAGCLDCWALAVVRIMRLKSLLRDLQPVPADLQQRVCSVAMQLRLKRVPTTWLVPGRIPPMLWTLGGRARLLVPAELWPELSESQQTALIAHELAHLKRKDHWVRWLDLAVTGLYWWHPVVWWARRGLREAEEQCCDAWAVWATPQGSRSYAAALLKALEFVAGAPTAGVAAAAAVISGKGHVAFLKRRMRMIVQARTPKTLSWAGRFAVLGLAALILPLAPTWAQKADSPKPDADRNAATTNARPESKILGYVWADFNNDGRPEKIVIQDRDQAAKPRQQLKEEAEDDDGDAADTHKDKEVADHLERLLKDLGDSLSKDLGPVGSEFLKALDKAVKDATEVLDKEGITSKDLHQALEKARDDLHEAFKEDGPLNKQARDAAEKATEDLKSAAEKAREELREAVREHADKAREAAREGLLSQSKEKDEPPATGADASGKPGEVEKARQEVRQMEQQLRQAMRRLQAIERRDQRLSRNQRRGAGGPPSPPTEKPPVASPAPPESPNARPVPPAKPEPPAPPASPRLLRRPDGFPGERLSPDMRRPGMAGPGGAALNPRVERRLRELEDKMDRLLKELDSLKSEKKDTPKPDGEQKSSSGRTRPRGRQQQPVRSRVIS